MEWLKKGIAKLEFRIHGLLNDSLETYDLHGPNARQSSAGARSPASEKTRLFVSAQGFDRLARIFHRGARRGRRDVAEKDLAKPTQNGQVIHTVEAALARIRPQLLYQQHSALSAVSAV